MQVCTPFTQGPQEMGKELYALQSKLQSLVQTSEESPSARQPFSHADMHLGGQNG
jgi:hypothetical protein